MVFASKDYCILRDKIRELSFFFKRLLQKSLGSKIEPSDFCNFTQNLHTSTSTATIDYTQKIDKEEPI